MSYIGNPRKGFSVLAYNYQKRQREEKAMLAPNLDLSNLQVISVTEPIATHRFDCHTCRKSIHRGDKHKKWVYKEFGEFKSVRMHLECGP